MRDHMQCVGKTRDHMQCVGSIDRHLGRCRGGEGDVIAGAYIFRIIMTYVQQGSYSLACVQWTKCKCTVNVNVLCLAMGYAVCVML